MGGWTVLSHYMFTDMVTLSDTSETASDAFAGITAG